MSNLSVLMIVITLIASLSVPFATALTCVSGSGTPCRAGKLECDGDQTNWQTCYVKGGAGSCLLMAFGK